MGTHSGGYDSFWFDITDYLEEYYNELIVWVFDPSDDGYQPNGKQVNVCLSGALNTAPAYISY